MTYNLLNLPVTSVKNAGTDNEITTEWTYLADGTKIGAYVSLYVDVADDADDPQLESVATVGGRFVMAIDPYSASFTAQQRYYITDHLGSTRVVLNNAGSVVERYDYYPYGEIVPVSVASSGNTDYLYTGKESQNALFGINWYDSGARFQTTDGIFTSLDPLAEKYYHISPYAYCKGNPINRLDPNGRKDYKYKEGKSLPITPVPFSKTPILINGRVNNMAYNCHSYAWHKSNGDPTPSKGDIPIKGSIPLTKWDNNPADDIKEQGARQLSKDENNKVGDIVEYFVDKNNNGKYDEGETIVHSAIVTKVDENGYTVEVTGKMGQGPIAVNHPDAPDYYKSDENGNKTTRAYFRKEENDNDTENSN